MASASARRSGLAKAVAENKNIAKIVI